MTEISIELGDKKLIARTEEQMRSAIILDPISSLCLSMNTLSLRSFTMRAEMRAGTLSRRGACLAAMLGAAFLLRMLWVQYGQQCRAIRLFNRSVLNPVTLTFAGRTGMPYAVLSQVGRRSGKTYATPLLVQPVTQGWIIPLTYGKATDWYRNIEQAGECRIQWQGKSFLAGGPECVDAAHALPLFPFALRLALRIAGIRHFVRLT